MYIRSSYADVFHATYEGPALLKAPHTQPRVAARAPTTPASKTRTARARTMLPRSGAPFVFANRLKEVELQYGAVDDASVHLFFGCVNSTCYFPHPARPGESGSARAVMIMSTIGITDCAVLRCVVVCCVVLCCVIHADRWITLTPSVIWEFA